MITNWETTKKRRYQSSIVNRRSSIVNRKWSLSDRPYQMNNFFVPKACPKIFLWVTPFFIMNIKHSSKEHSRVLKWLACGWRTLCHQIYSVCVKLVVAYQLLAKFLYISDRTSQSSIVNRNFFGATVSTAGLFPVGPDIDIILNWGKEQILGERCWSLQTHYKLENYWRHQILMRK